MSFMGSNTLGNTIRALGKYSSSYFEHTMDAGFKLGQDKAMLYGAIGAGAALSFGANVFGNEGPISSTVGGIGEGIASGAVIIGGSRGLFGRKAGHMIRKYLDEDLGRISPILKSPTAAAAAGMLSFGLSGLAGGTINAATGYNHPMLSSLAGLPIGTMAAVGAFKAASAHVTGSWPGWMSPTVASSTRIA